MMKRIGALSALCVLAGFLVLLVGCEALTSGDEARTSEGNPSYSAGTMDEAAAPAVFPVVVPQEEPDDLIDEERDRRALESDQTTVLVEKFVADGKALLEANKLEEAQSAFAHAIDLDPYHEEARDLFNRVGNLLGERSPTIADITSQTRNRMEVRRAQNRMKAESLVRQADAHVDTGDLEEAIRMYEDAVLIVRWNPYLDEGMLEEDTVVGKLEAAKERFSQENIAREQEIQERILKQQQELEQAEQEQAANRIQRLYTDANNAFLNDHYRQCELILDELLKLDPQNASAQELLGLAVKARHDQSKEQTRREYKSAWRKTFDEIEFDDLPVTNLLTFPSDKEWEKISRRGRQELSRKKDSMNPEDEEIRSRLMATEIPIVFEQTTLEDLVNYFKATTGVNFIVSQGIIDSGDDPLFDLRTPPRPALRPLDLLLSMAMPPCKYNIKNGVVTIMLQEEPLGNYVLDVYDIRDLSKTISNFPAKDFNLAPSNTMTNFDEDMDEDEENPDVIGNDTLVDLIRANISPASWDDDTNNTIATIGNYLVVRQSPEVHEKINQLLTDLRNSAGLLVNIETRFISVEDNFLQDIGVDFRGLDGNPGDFANPNAAVPNVLLDDFGDFGTGYGDPSDPHGLGSGNDSGIYYDDGEDGDYMGRLENLLDLQLGEDGILDNSGGSTVQFTFLGDIALQAILRAVEKSSQANIIQAPNITVYNGQRSSITAITNTAYMKDFDPEVAQASVVAEPVVDIVQEGVILDVKPVISSDRRFVTMELRPTIASLKREYDGSFKEFTTGLGVGEGITIEMPELEVQRLRTTVCMPDQSTLLLGGMKISTYQNFDTGLPFFKHIPILSFILSRKSTFESKRKLLILVKATIIIPEESEPLVGPASR